MDARMVRSALCEHLHTHTKHKVPFYRECSVCHRDDTEGCIDVSHFNRDYYRECCSPGIHGVPLGGTLFVTTARRVVCTDCVLALGWRGKAATYGVTLSMLVLAGARMCDIASFWRAPFSGPPSKTVCEYSGDALKMNWHVCDVCYVLLCAGALPSRRRLCGCKANPLAVLPSGLPLQQPHHVPKALRTLALMTLSTADLGVVRQLEVSIA